MHTRGARLVGPNPNMARFAAANEEWPVSERDVVFQPLAGGNNGLAKPPNVVSMFARPPTRLA